MRTFLLELAKREHNVTVYSSHRLDERLDNLKEYIIEPEFQFWKEGKYFLKHKHTSCMKCSYFNVLLKFSSEAIR